jgi:hypothetical protein
VTARLVQVAERVREIELAVKQCDAGRDIDVPDLRKFACKHLQAMIKVEKELQRAPASDCHCKVLNSEPVDVEKLPLEEQCVMEVLQGQIEKAGGAFDGATYTITKEMVDAKMREKKHN